MKSTAPSISVVIPAHNPDPARLRRALHGLRRQSLPSGSWESLLIDNASEPPLQASELAAEAPVNFRVVRESKLGLTPARVRGFKEASAELIVLVDDDNVLTPDYLEVASSIAAANPHLGAWSGNVTLEFERGANPPPPQLRHLLTERHVTRDNVSTSIDDHDSTPWGAGLCLRRGVVDAYLAALKRDPLRQELDLKGKALLYGGDTDIAYVGCEAGFSKGVFAGLHVTHLIPPHRCELGYLMRALEGHSYSAVFHASVLGKPLPTHLAHTWWRTKRLMRRWRKPRLDRLVDVAIERGQLRALRDLTRISRRP